MAAASEQEKAGNSTYQNEHMAQLFEEGMSFSGFERDALYLARGDGTYMDVSGVSGLDSISDGRGLAFGDLDNDGDMDVVIVPVQEAARLVYRNNVGQDNDFVRVVLRGTRSASDAFGAIVKLETSRGTQTKIKSGGSGFLSFSDSRLLFGLGPNAPDGPYPLSVLWPSGLEERYDVQSGESVRLVEGKGLLPLDLDRLELPAPRTTSERIFKTLAIGKGEPFPKLALTPVDASMKTAIAASGRKMLVNFWATWCVPCTVEMPELERLFPKLEAAGVELVGISVDTDTNAVPSYLEARKISYPNYTLAESDFGKIFAGASLTVPLTLVLDAGGNVIDAFSGWSASTRSAIEALAGSP